MLNVICVGLSMAGTRELQCWWVSMVGTQLDAICRYLVLGVFYLLRTKHVQFQNSKLQCSRSL